MTFRRNTIITLAANLGVTLMGFVTGLLLARTVGPVGRGIMTTILLWPQMLIWAGGFSLGYANIFYGAVEPYLRKRLHANSFYVSIFLGIIVASIASVIIPNLVHLSPFERRLLIFSLMVNIPIGMWTDYAIGLLQSTNDFRRWGAIRSLPPAVTMVGLVICALMHCLNVTNALISTWIGGWIATSFTLRYLIHAGDIGLTPDIALLKRSFHYSIKVHLGTLANLANGRLDQLIMTAIVSTKALGLYAFAVTLSEMLNQVASAISLAIMPKVAGEQDPQVQRTIAIRCARWTLLIGMLGAVLLYIIAPYAIQLLWGKRFVEATPAVRVLLPGTVMLGLARTLCSTMRGIGKPMAGTWAELASLAVMIPMLFYLLPSHGIVGAGIASSCGYIVNGIVLVIFFAQTFGWRSLYELRPSRSDWDYARTSVTKMINRKPVPAAE